MTKTIEKYYCDVCGRETYHKCTGSFKIESRNVSIGRTEVCDDCCKRLFDIADKMIEDSSQPKK